MEVEIDTKVVKTSKRAKIMVVQPQSALSSARPATHVTNLNLATQVTRKMEPCLTVSGPSTLQKIIVTLLDSHSNIIPKMRKRSETDLKTVSLNISHSLQNSATLTDSVEPPVDDDSEYSTFGIIKSNLFE